MEPHPALAHRYQVGQKARFVDGLFDAGAEHYDDVVNWGFLHSGTLYRRAVQKRYGLKTGHRVLDVACGTGLVAVEAAKILGTAQNITCLDASAGMLAIARKKLSATFIQGRAESLPLPDASFDFITMGYALRHVTDMQTTFSEFQRVLCPGGTALILEITRPTSSFGRILFKLYFGRIYPSLAGIFTRSQKARQMMHYYWETMDACVPATDVVAAMHRGGLSNVRYRRIGGIFSEFSAVRP